MQQVLFALVLTAASLGAQAQKTKVIIEIENVHTRKGGDIAAAIFGKTNFLKMEKPVRAASQKVNAAKMILVFDDLPPGAYAFVAFQDIDQDKSLRKNFIGYPAEPFGISNNPRMIFGPPSFEDAKLNLRPGQHLTVRITLN